MSLFDPAIPYLTLPEVPLLPAFDAPLFGHVGPVTAKPFGALVMTGVLVGWRLGYGQIKRLGLDTEVYNSLFFAIMAGGFLGGHAFDVLLYHPQRLSHAKSVAAAFGELIAFWGSQSSFGGFLGAFLGLAVWKRQNPGSPTLAFVDTIAAIFPCGWAFGRTGCALMHDHPGMRSDAWLAVRYPDGGRFDLGLLELAFTVPLALAFFVAMRKPRTPGFYLAVLCTTYAPVRFGLDFLRARDVADADPRRLGLTPAQWLSFALFAVGVAFAVRVATVASARRPG